MPAIALALIGTVSQIWLTTIALSFLGQTDGTAEAMPFQPAELIVGMVLSTTASIVALVFLARRLTQIATSIKGIAADLVQLTRTNDPDAADANGETNELCQLKAAIQGVSDVIEESIQSRMEFERTASEDALTGALNRRGLHDYFDGFIGTGRGPSSGLFGLMHVDLDHFKTINDTAGHAAGDFVLKEATNRMRAIIGDDCVLSRIGGDEFVVIVPDIAGAMALGELAERIVEQFQAPIVYLDSVCRIGASVGTVTSSKDIAKGDLDRLLIDADTALCHAKLAGRGRFVAFQPEMARQINDDRDRAREIRNGLLHDQFRPWFQPMLNVVTGEVIGIEVLSRWEHPTRGVLLPEAFLGAADAHNMIEEIGTQVLEQACRTVSAWERRGLGVPRLHVNMSRAEMLAPAIVDKISWILDDTNIAPEKIAIEISESDCTGRSADLIFANLGRLSDIGMDIVLDGFGVEDGSVKNLIRLGVQRLKCSRKLLQRSTSKQEERSKLAMLRSALGLGTSLGVAVVLKGVETTRQVDAMLAEGFAEMQGDFFASVMSEADAAQWLADHQKPEVAKAG